MSTPISFVQAPFLIGQQGVEVQNLQHVLLLLAEQGVISVPTTLTDQVNTEMTAATLGSATAQLVKFFIVQNNIKPANDLLVDDVVARAINEKLNAASLSPLQHTVSGYVTLENVNYTPTVTLYQVFLRSKTAIASASIDTTGFYYISYDPAVLDNSTPNIALQIAVHTEGEVPKEFPSDVLYNASANAQITLGNDVINTSYVEYTEIASAVTTVAPDIQFHDIDLASISGEVTSLAQQTGESEDRIAQFITANKIASELAVGADIIYALIRQNISIAYQPLLAYPNDVLVSNLMMAMVNNTIATISGVPAIVTALKSAILHFLISDSTGDAAASTTYESVKHVLGGDDVKTRSFLSAYYSYPPNSDGSVWDYAVSTDASLASYIDGLKRTISLIALVGNNPALVISLYDQTTPPMGGITTFSLTNPPIVNLPSLATFSKTDWVNTLNNTQSSNGTLFAIPDTITGATQAERISNYADTLQATFGVAYPTQSVNTHITTDTTTPFVTLKTDLTSFINSNANFDIRTVSTADLADPNNTTYNFSGVSDRQAFSDEVGVVQRLMNVTQDNSLITALAKDGLHSSLQIVQDSLENFAGRYAVAAGSLANATALYAKAQSVTTFNMAAAIDKYFQFAGRTVYALGDITKAGTEGAYAEWRSLFGSLDSCNCSQCTSVYSPSAYMVDMLRFLKNNVSGAVHDALVNTRRPDIKDIELSCKNTNTAVPQIDMVNEMLEDLVSTGQYKLFARQTVADAATQRAIPEYVNTTGMDFGATHVDSPYPKLKAAKYPQGLPYNFYKRQIDAHLGIGGVKGHELMARFSEFDPIETFSNSQFCFEYIGLSNESALAITTKPATTGVLTDLMELYGLKPLSGTAPRQIPDPANKGSYVTPTVTSSNWITVLGSRVDVFLQQTQLEYRDLLQLLDCYTINPIISTTGGIVVRKIEILAAATANADTCALNLLQINGLDTSVLAILSRFVRTARALNWSYYELDRALRVLQPAAAGATGEITDSTLTSLIQLKRVTELLKCTVEEACMFYTNTVDTLPYRDYTKSEPADIPSQYQRIFCNDLVSNVKAPDYPFLPDGTILTVTQETLIKYLAGVVHISPSDADLIVDQLFGGNPIDTLADISAFYTYALLIRKLKMTVTEWLKLRQWTQFSAYFQGSVPNYFKNINNITPFNYPLYTIQYIEIVRLLKDAQFSMSDVEYLLSDKVADAIADDAVHAGFVKSLTSFRAQLSKIRYPDYDPSADTGSAILEEALNTIIDAEKAAGLTAIIENTAGPFTDIDTTLVDKTLDFLIPAGGVTRLTDPTTTTNTYIADIIARRTYVFECLKTYTLESVMKPATVSFFAKEFKIAEDVTEALLESAIGYDVTTGGTTVHQSAYDVLLSDTFLTDTDTAISRWTATGTATAFNPQFNIILQLHKAAILINKFGLGLSDVNYLWIKQTIPGVLLLSNLPTRNTKTQPSSTPTLTSDKAPFIAIAQLIYWMQVRAFLGDSAYVLFDGLATITTDIKDEVLLTIATAFRTSKDDITVLLGADTGAGNPPDDGVFQILNRFFYGSPFTYLRIINCLEMQSLLPASMKTLAQAAQAVATANDQNTASVVMQLVKSQFTDSQWLDQIKPVNDMLRMERRDAMVAYLLAYPPTGYENKWFTDNDIYETMMVDVEMTPCMPTTRVLLAINTIQLWVERILLGLESSYTLNKDNARQWNTWRKLYRVWEANRKIFLYPENWIEPELRDGKSPFFLELEKNLKQNDVTMQVVEDAYATYLERLDEVSHLDIVGMYQETTPAKAIVLHVFGRSKSAPHNYYYRKYAANEWTPWEKMNVQIDSDHFVPVVWRNRLRFYWLVFTKDSIPQSADRMRSNDAFTPPDGVRWKVDLAWTEYKNGAWTAQQIGKQSWYSFTITEEDPISWEHIVFFNNVGYERNWYFAGSLDRVKKDRLNFYCSIDADGELQFNMNELVVRRPAASIRDSLYRLAYPPDGKYTVTNQWGNVVSVAATQLNDGQVRDAIAKMKAIQNEDLPNQNYLDYFGNEGYFTVKFNGVVASQSNNTVPSLYHGYYNTSSLLRNGYRLEGTDYLYVKPAAQGYSHYSDSNATLLKTAPAWTSDPTGNRYLVFPRIVPQGYVANQHIGINYFFYKDFKNTFFVEGVSKGSTLPFTMNGDGSIAIPVPRTDGLEPTYIDTKPTFGRTDGTIRPDFSGWANASYVTGWGNYTFHNFHHDNVDDFMEKFSAGGLDALLDRTFINGIQDKMAFVSKYDPVTLNVDMINIPTTKVDFSSNGAYSSYNWELFYHIPMLIANKLCQNQQFEDARTWYQYVFNPTAINPNATHDFWNFQPFYDIASQPPQTLNDVMSDKSLKNAVDNWANDPFKPHLVARTRPTAYMKNTVMKYLDNLIAWGDYLFSTDTRENINEATLLYVLAAQILGDRPVKVPARAKTKVYTYATLSSSGTNWNAFANALVKIESVMLASGATGISTTNTNSTQLSSDSMYYFCLPSNDQLDLYWDTIADRLFKIRNCQSIDGVQRELALFDPPIDPALLVKAAASGLNLANVINGLNAPLPNYRFNVLSQKATELAQEVKGLGSQLLSALEKKDAESLALLRSSQELSVLDAVTELKQKQVDEAGSQIDALNTQLASATQRRDYYSQLIDGGLSGQEILQLESIGATIPVNLLTSGIQSLAAGLRLIPELTIGAFSAGAQTGGHNYSENASKGAKALTELANINSTIGTMAGINAGFKRRAADWGLQLKISEKEITQLNQQITAAEIRKAIAEVDLNNHKLQLRNAQDMDTAMREKYTNEELYDWMIGQISFSYFQAYKLACDIAKRAERCYQYELAIEPTNFIQAGYWDNLKKGLLAGEQLIYDIKRMETSYLEKNKRQLELTKHISLAMLAPDQLVQLKQTGKCDGIDLGEWLFDMDYPGHYMRRIKSVSISIPCVAGPYTTISCKLSQTKSKYRKNSLLLAEKYEEQTDGSENRFVYQYGNIQSIATSSAQNDAGMFELNFRDERYLPFEGSGAISSWNIELPSVYAQFDYSSISDIILHVKYTALDGGGITQTAAENHVKALFAAGIDDNAHAMMPRLFDIKREFSNEWVQYVKAFTAAPDTAALSFQLGHNMFPYFCNGQNLTVTNCIVNLTPKTSLGSNYKFKLSYDTTTVEIPITDYKGNKTAEFPIENGAFTSISMIDGSGKTVNMDDLLEEMNLIIEYMIGDGSGTGSSRSGIGYWIIGKNFQVS